MTSARTPTPPAVKWLANQLAATRGELDRIDEQMARLTARRTQLTEEHAALSAAAGLLAVPGLPDCVPTVRPHAPGGRGSLVAFLLDSLCAAHPRYIDTVTLGAAAMQRFGRSFPNAAERNRWVHSVLALTRLEELLDVYGMLGIEQRDAVRDAILQARTNGVDPEIEALWNRLRELIGRHRKFPGTFWAMPSAELEKLDAVEAVLRPDSAQRKFLWLFQEHFPDTDIATRDMTLAATELSRRRKAAMESVLEEGGTGGVLSFLRAAKLTYVACQSLKDAGLSSAQALTLVTACADRGEPVDMRILAHVNALEFEAAGSPWSSQVRALSAVACWPAPVIAACFQAYPHTVETFRTVASFGHEVERCFWLNHSGYLPKDRPKAATFAAIKLLEFGRALDVIDQPLAALRTRLLRKTLGQCAQLFADTPESSRDDVRSYNLNEALAEFRRRPGVTLREVARYEYPMFRKIYDYDDEESSGHAIHQLLAKDPDEFIKVLCDKYRADWEEPNEDPDDAVVARASCAFHVLSSWRLAPGVVGSNIDGPALASWIRQARHKAAVLGRAEVGDQAIGAVLLHTPPSADGEWPQRTVCDLYQEVASSPMELGTELEVVNSRGVTTRGLLEGGRQERALADLWKARAACLSARHSRAKAMCNRISASYAEDAARMDSRADLQRLRSSR